MTEPQLELSRGNEGVLVRRVRVRVQDTEKELTSTQLASRGAIIAESGELKSSSYSNKKRSLSGNECDHSNPKRTINNGA